MSGMAAELGSGSAKVVVAICECQLLLLVPGEGTAQFSRP